MLEWGGGSRAERGQSIVEKSTDDSNVHPLPSIGEWLGIPSRRLCACVCVCVCVRMHVCVCWGTLAEVRHF